MPGTWLFACLTSPHTDTFGKIAFLRLLRDLGRHGIIMMLLYLMINVLNFVIGRKDRYIILLTVNIIFYNVVYLILYHFKSVENFNKS